MLMKHVQVITLYNCSHLFFTHQAFLVFYTLHPCLSLIVNQHFLELLAISFHPFRSNPYSGAYGLKILHDNMGTG